jgi:hypothetical protein
VTQIVTTAQLGDKAERGRRLARGGDPLTTKLLAALAETYAAEADEQAAEEAPRRRAERSSLEWRSSWMPHSHS